MNDRISKDHILGIMMGLSAGVLIGYFLKPRETSSPAGPAPSVPERTRGRESVDSSAIPVRAPADRPSAPATR